MSFANDRPAKLQIVHLKSRKNPKEGLWGTFQFHMVLLVDLPNRNIPSIVTLHDKTLI